MHSRAITAALGLALAALLLASCSTKEVERTIASTTSVCERSAAHDPALIARPLGVAVDDKWGVAFFDHDGYLSLCLAGPGGTATSQSPRDAMSRLLQGPLRVIYMTNPTGRWFWAIVHEDPQMSRVVLSSAATHVRIDHLGERFLLVFGRANLPAGSDGRPRQIPEGVLVGFTRTPGVLASTTLNVCSPSGIGFDDRC